LLMGGGGVSQVHIEREEFVVSQEVGQGSMECGMA
jgi:hypothetical protein